MGEEALADAKSSAEAFGRRGALSSGVGGSSPFWVFACKALPPFWVTVVRGWKPQ